MNREVNLARTPAREHEPERSQTLQPVGSLSRALARLMPHPTSACPTSSDPAELRATLASLTAEQRRRDDDELAAHRAQVAQTRLEAQFGRAGIPRRYLHADFGIYQATTAAQVRAVEICARYAESFHTAHAVGANLLLIGNPGTGKTHLACAILASILRQGYTGLFASLSEALRTIRATYDDRAAMGEPEAWRIFTGPDLLVLDEIGVAIGTDAKRSAMLFDLLNARYNDQRPTVLIANLSLEELRAYLGERAWDRMTETGSVVLPFTWGSYRQRARP